MRGPWRNRMHSLYTEFCYLDELPYKEQKLIELYGGYFDDHYEVKLASPSKRQVALRTPLGGDAKAEYGDAPRDITRQNRVPDGKILDKTPTPPVPLEPVEKTTLLSSFFFLVDRKGSLSGPEPSD